MLLDFRPLRSFFLLESQQTIEKLEPLHREFQAFGEAPRPVHDVLSERVRVLNLILEHKAIRKRVLLFCRGEGRLPRKHLEKDGAQRPNISLVAILAAEKSFRGDCGRLCLALETVAEVVVVEEFSRAEVAYFESEGGFGQVYG